MHQFLDRVIIFLLSNYSFVINQAATIRYLDALQVAVCGRLMGLTGPTNTPTAEVVWVRDDDIDVLGGAS